MCNRLHLRSHDVILLVLASSPTDVACPVLLSLRAFCCFLLRWLSQLVILGGGCMYTGLHRRHSAYSPAGWTTLCTLSRYEHPQQGPRGELRTMQRTCSVMQLLGDEKRASADCLPDPPVLILASSKWCKKASWHTCSFCKMHVLVPRSFSMPRSFVNARFLCLYACSPAGYRAVHYVLRLVLTILSPLLRQQVLQGGQATESVRRVLASNAFQMLDGAYVWWACLCVRLCMCVCVTGG